MLGRTQPLEGTFVIVKEKEENNTMLQSMVRNHNPHGSPPPIEAGQLLSDSCYAMMKGKTMSMKVV
jgi:hypothetical protein